MLVYCLHNGNVSMTSVSMTSIAAAFLNLTYVASQKTVENPIRTHAHRRKASYRIMLGKYGRD